MAVLTEGRLMPDVKQINNVFGGYLIDFVILNGEIIYKGAFVALTPATGEVHAATTTAEQVIGIATETVDNTADGLSVECLCGALIEHPITGAVQATMGDIIYASDDQTLLITAGTNALVGYFAALTGTAQGLVKMFMPGENID